jgi:hypothetical protein
MPTYVSVVPSDLGVCYQRSRDSSREVSELSKLFKISMRSSLDSGQLKPL